ncbi:hypothetical protein DAEQUDRAFT_324349 [Daedalea quercina L-15889]|uniref:Uncharacterized protein n=1 Tax=Daedalea quercina L-15889 TaxID=1314783 RepID=A0A165PTR5_9APHY|nr:hypothetical protein DAEQUDRAFT_324349 [Daedalea quercina L-15889]
MSQLLQGFPGSDTGQGSLLPGSAYSIATEVFPDRFSTDGLTNAYPVIVIISQVSHSQLATCQCCATTAGNPDRVILLLARCFDLTRARSSRRRLLWAPQASLPFCSRRMYTSIFPILYPDFTTCDARSSAARRILLPGRRSVEY